MREIILFSWEVQVEFGCSKDFLSPPFHAHSLFGTSTFRFGTCTISFWISDGKFVISNTFEHEIKTCHGIWHRCLFQSQLMVILLLWLLQGAWTDDFSLQYPSIVLILYIQRFILLHFKNWLPFPFFSVQFNPVSSNALHWASKTILIVCNRSCLFHWKRWHLCYLGFLREFAVLCALKLFNWNGKWWS